ncbi:MAG: M14 family zinc carboxypeptidase, partial [Candidatus Methanofastidiosia archaeon]
MEKSPTMTAFMSATPTLTLSPTPTSTITLTPTPSITPTPLPPEGEAFSIGLSIEGKNIDVFRFGNGSNVRMIVGGIHGGYEWNTSVLAYLLIDDIKNGRITIPSNKTLYILPILNPDGYFDYPDSSYGRGNARSVDLNRNWDAVWEVDWA